jgi:hypothetical protein
MLPSLSSDSSSPVHPLQRLQAEGHGFLAWRYVPTQPELSPIVFGVSQMLELTETNFAAPGRQNFVHPKDIPVADYNDAIWATVRRANGQGDRNAGDGRHDASAMSGLLRERI